jgi:hypothetical protein
MLTRRASNRIRLAPALAVTRCAMVLATLVAASPPAPLRAEPSTVLWAISGGGANSDMGFAIAADPDGNALLVGRMTDAAALAGAEPPVAGDLDAAIAKFGPEGELLWVRRPGGPGRDSAQGIASDSQGNVLVTGFFCETGDFDGKSTASAGHRDIFVAKYDPAGSLLWLRRAGGPLIDEGRAIATDSAGNIFVTGSFEGEVTFSDDSDSTVLTAEGEGDAFLAKYDPDGTLLWVRQGGGEDHTWANSVAVDSAGNALITGSFGGKAAFGDTMLLGEGGLGVFVAKYGPDGALQWARAASGSGRDVGHAVAADRSDNVVVTGSFSRSITFGATALNSDDRNDAFIAKYTPAGAVAWARAIGGGGEDAVRAIVGDGRGNLLVTGSFRGEIELGSTRLTSAGNRDIFVAALDPEGTAFWARSAGGTDTDNGFGIASDGQGGFYITGSFADTAVFNGVALTSAGSDDLFIVRMAYRGP